MLLVVEEEDDKEVVSVREVLDLRLIMMRGVGEVVGKEMGPRDWEEVMMLDVGY